MNNLAEYLSEPERRKLFDALFSEGGRTLDRVLERRIADIELLAGQAVLQPAGTDERRIAAVKPFIEEREHLRYALDAIELLREGTASPGTG